MSTTDNTNPIHIPLHRRGPALWPEVMPEALLRKLRKLLSTLLFEASYQGEPASAAGAIFQAAWFGDYTAHPHLLEIGQAWDTALKDEAGHDYSCGITAGRDADGMIYLLDCWRGQVQTPELQRRLVALAERWRPRWVLVEDTGAGTALLQNLRRQRLPLIGVRPKGSKLARAKAVTPLVEDGSVRLPANAPWREAFLAELQSFPTGRHDDQVDAFVYLLSRFQGHGVPPPVAPGRPPGW